jgi:citrate synthase
LGAPDGVRGGPTSESRVSDDATQARQLLAGRGHPLAELGDPRVPAADEAATLGIHAAEEATQAAEFAERRRRRDAIEILSLDEDGSTANFVDLEWSSLPE